MFKTSEAFRAYVRTYKKTPRGQEVEQRYERSEKGKACKARRDRKFRKAWRKTAEGRAARNAGAKRWRATPNGRLSSQRTMFKRDLRAKYGLTLDQFHSMLVAQAGRCALCEKPMIGPAEPHVDHCHATSRVRGLLHSRCNLMLGWFETTQPLFPRILTYLGSP